MNNAMLSITLVGGGAALAAMAVLSLTSAMFATMPKPVAGAVLAAGAGIVVFGALLPRITAVDDEDVVPLEQRSAGATAEPLLEADIWGTVRTVDGEPRSGVQITLWTSDGDTVTGELNKTDAHGRFRYDDQPIDGPIRLEAEFDGAVFEAPALRRLSDPVEILVADTTKDDRSLTVRASSLALVGDRRGIQAVQAITIDNGGDEAFAGDLRLPLLPKANSLVPGIGLSRARLDVAGGRLVSRSPVLPGRTELTYTYAAPLPARGVDFVSEAVIGTKRFDLLLSKGLSATDIQPSPRIDDARIGNRSYERLSWRRIDEGARVRARISPREGVPLLRVGLVALVILAGVALVLAPIVRRRRAT